MTHINLEVLLPPLSSSPPDTVSSLCTKRMAGILSPDQLVRQAGCLGEPGSRAGSSGPMSVLTVQPHLFPAPLQSPSSRLPMRPLRQMSPLHSDYYSQPRRSPQLRPCEDAHNYSFSVRHKRTPGTGADCFYGN